MSSQRNSTGGNPPYLRSPQQQGSPNPNNQSPQPGSNGGHAHYAQPQYPGQPTYGYHAPAPPYQPPPQQSGAQDTYAAPVRQYSVSAQYPGQAQYQYNPQDYSQSHQPQPLISPYNPRNYVDTGQGAYNPQHYAPNSAFSPTSPIATSATSGPLDTFAYQQQASYPNPAHQFPQSPQHSVHSPQQSFSPRSPTQPIGYASNYAPSPPHQRSQFASPISPIQAQSVQHQSGNYYPSPPARQYSDTRQSPSPLYPTFSHASASSQGISPGPTPPVHAPSRTGTLGRHPDSRPLPITPETDTEADYFYNANDAPTYLSREQREAVSQQELFQQVEDAVRGAPGRPSHSPSISVSQPPTAPMRASSASLFAQTQPGAARSEGALNGHLHPAAAEHVYSSDSDAEAAQGLAMMQMADEDEARRRQSGGGQTRFGSGYASQRGSLPQPLPLPPEASDSDDYGAVDMTSFGGYDVHMAYGGDPSTLAVGGEMNGYNHYSQPPSQQSSMRRSHASQSSQASRDYEYAMNSIHPFRPFNAPARVDAGGTGGLSEPTADGRRLSYDEGDEYAFLEGGIPDRFPDEPPDIFYQPASTSYRPLPAPPGNEYMPPLQTDFREGQPPSPYPAAPDEYHTLNQHGQWVPRSSSLMSHPTTPHASQPSRSKTDAELRKLPPKSTPITPALDLPSLPGKRFMPSQLGAPAFKKCEEPWSLMSILKWLLQVTNPEQVTELKEAEVKEALVALFTNKVPTMNIADAETLSNRVVQDMYGAETLIATEEWVKVVPGPMSGVIFQLTGTGCYSPTLHDHVIPGRCYSHHCQRTLKKVNLLGQKLRTSESWAEYYRLTKEDVEGKDKKELERQYMLHETVTTEETYMEQLSVLRTLYRDALSRSEPSIISPKRKTKFLTDVFGKFDAIQQANEEHLLPQLKYRQQEQGPWIVGFSDIFRQWIRKAKAAYIDYAGAFPGATFLVRQEIDRNLDFRTFIERARSDKKSNKLGWDTYLKAPITRLQRYTLLLAAVLKTMKTESEEKANLKLAYDEVKAVTLECDARVADMQTKVDLMDLQHKLVLRPGMQNAVELNLDHFGRELIHRGDLQRMGGNRFTWLDSHGLLFDHYLVLAKTVSQRSEQGGKVEKYDVSRLPIPMDLLILESASDPAVQKSSYMKGITSVRDVTGRTSTPQAGGDTNNLGRVQSPTSPAPQLQHTNTAASGASLTTVTTLSENKDADKIMYPFKVKHLGRDTYTLFAPTEQARREWCMKITEAKIKHAASLYNQNAEPFKLRVMADAAFVFDAFAGTAGKAPTIKGTPVDRAIQEVEQKFKEVGKPGPICRARVNCATSFATPHPENKQMVAVGTDFGVFVSEMNNPRGWSKAISMSRVTQVAVLEEFNLFLLISDKSLIAYHLDTLFPTGATTTPNDTASKAPQKLSGSKDVGFFVTGRMKERALVFYKKRENLASVFKVLEPVYQKSTERRRGMFRRGNTEFFRDYDEFYIPAECTGINLFHSSLSVSTSKGFEVMTLERKQAMSVPDLSAQHVQNIASHIKEEKALSMLRLSDQEFLLVYARCAVYMNKHSDVSRSVIMEFVGCAQSAALYGPYLVLFDRDFVEIRNAQNGRLKQIIAGREVKCLDDGGSWSAAGGSGGGGSESGGRTVKFVMQHPEQEKTQIVVELLLNEKMKEGLD
ncbi:CNH domain-containing protein [Neohortaea acidophila]|uniref:CNH domain-containing protein n=1 Tax=Neohortaea acidophila TaxID=245834 RepID=A0A6A6PU32_9PEZI|nr:CNH domain-containing protein [Neohortaea acidophila]KAF2482727.1 CNH domain-containing protein [Neohortaea acidophila]